MMNIENRFNPPELLSPAGDWQALKAAVANGADAVYFGLDQFNARHRATNFTLAELPELMGYLHAHNVKGFLAFNILIFSDELAEAAEYLKKVAAAGVDAVIVQDVGLAALIHRLVPTLAIHASTQMTLSESRGLEFARGLGVVRAVLPRELSVEDIRKIREKSDLPVEVFVHGALCVAYSGQCLTSESIGGRSANRGQCAQACRLPYQLIVDGVTRDLGDKAYLVSPQDLAAYDLIGELTDAGVASFKIEGRLKSAHYVAATTQTYRAAIDHAIKGDRSPFLLGEQQAHDLTQSFSRGFTSGFLRGVNHQELVQGRFPKLRGVRVGTVSATTPTSVIVTLDQPLKTQDSGLMALKPGDGVVFDEGHPDQDEQGGRVYGVYERGGKSIEITFAPGAVNVTYLVPGTIVWKTDDPAMKKRLEQTFNRDVVAHREKLATTLTAKVGQAIELQVRDAAGREASARGKVLEKANKHPATKEAVVEQLSRLGDTPFEMGELKFIESGGPMIPKSVLNDLRREAVGALLTARRKVHAVEEAEALEHWRADIAAWRGAQERAGGEANLIVLVRTLEQLGAVLSSELPLRPAMIYADFEDVRRYKEAVAVCRAAGMPLALATLRIVKPHEDGFLNQIADCRPDAVLVRNIAAMRFYREVAPGLPQIGDYSLNVANELTAAVFRDQGMVRLVPSHDLNWKQLAAMLGRIDPGLFESVVHQHMPMFHMEHCVFAHTLSNGTDYKTCGRPCEKHTVDLTDRVGEPHPLIPDVGCRNTLFNAEAQSAADFIPEMKRLGVRHFRVELLRENAGDAASILKHYGNLLLGQEEARMVTRSLKVLSGFGVTQGTLVHE